MSIPSQDKYLLILNRMAARLHKKQIQLSKEISLMEYNRQVLLTEIATLTQGKEAIPC